MAQDTDPSESEIDCTVNGIKLSYLPCSSSPRRAQTSQ